MANRLDPPVSLDWSSIKIKVLGVFLGTGNLDDDNWRPRIDAVANTLFSWRQRILSFRGRALVINALGVGVVCGFSCPHAPWVHGELIRLVFKFFWIDKRDLASQSDVVQAPPVGVFSMVDVKLNVQSLLVQWVKRFVLTSSSWSALMIFWFHSVFDYCRNRVKAKRGERDLLSQLVSFLLQGETGCWRYLLSCPLSYCPL